LRTPSCKAPDSRKRGQELLCFLIFGSLLYHSSTLALSPFSSSDPAPLSRNGATRRLPPAGPLVPGFFRRPVLLSFLEVPSLPFAESRPCSLDTLVHFPYILPTLSHLSFPACAFSRGDVSLCFSLCIPLALLGARLDDAVPFPPRADMRWESSLVDPPLPPLINLLAFHMTFSFTRPRRSEKLVPPWRSELPFLSPSFLPAPLFAVRVRDAVLYHCKSTLTRSDPPHSSPPPNFLVFLDDPYQTCLQ